MRSLPRALPRLVARDGGVRPASQRRHRKTTTVESFSSRFEQERCPSGCFAEGTPSNLRVPSVPGRLYGLMTPGQRLRARFVAIVREPVARDISWFNHFILGKLHGNATLNASLAQAMYEAHAHGGVTAWNRCLHGQESNLSVGVFNACESSTALSIGMYWPQLETWYRAGWPRHQLLVVTFNMLCSEPQAFQRRVYQHLGLSSVSGMSGEMPHAHPASSFAGAATVTAVGVHTRRVLEELYAPWNWHLFDANREMLGRPPAGWSLL